MSEEFSNKPPQKIEHKESAERPRQYRTIGSEILEPRKDGTETVRVLECNDILHRRCVDRISYNERGEVIFAEQLSREELGPCNCEK